MRKKQLHKYSLFFAGLFSKINISLVGQIAVSELIILLDLLNVRSWLSFFKTKPLFKKTLFFLLLYLFSQVTSDIVNGTLSRDYLRGWANILLSALILDYHIFF